MQSQLFPNNTRSNFQTDICESDLSYLCNSPFQVAIKSITFDHDIDLGNSECRTLGLYSNITDDIISSYGWDKILCFFTISAEKGIFQIDFKNPVFYPSDIRRLSKAKFKIVDLSTGEAPNFSFGCPTFIEVVVKDLEQRMKAPFALILDSSCPKSKQLFPKNKQMEFVIQLPQRMVFDRESWLVCLKGITLTNKLLPGQDFWISITEQEDRPNPSNTLTKLFTPLDELIREHQPNHNHKVWFSSLSNQSITHIDELINILNHDFKDNVIFSINYEGFIKMSLLKNNLIIRLSESMKMLLGVYDCNPINNEIISNKAPNLKILIPHQFLVTSNIVGDTLLGGQLVQVLKYFSSNGEAKNQYEFYNNDFVKLTCKNFDRIKIRISDLSGNIVNCNDDMPTRLQILFVNTDI